MIECDGESLSFEYYFLNEYSFIYNVHIIFNGASFSKVKNLVITKINNNLILIKILHKNDVFLIKKCKKVEKSGLFFNFYQNGLVEIETNAEQKLSEAFDCDIVDADVMEMKNNYYCLKLIGKNSEMALILDNNIVPIMQLNTAIIEITENGFKSLTNLNDIACHGLVEIFELTDNDVKKIDEYSVFLKSKPLNTFNVNVLPIYFLQCVKAKDFAEAKNCLSGDLKLKVSAEHLSAYFGNFNDIVCLKSKYYLTYKQQENNLFFVKECEFNILNGKIANINVLNG